MTIDSYHTGLSCFYAAGAWPIRALGCDLDKSAGASAPFLIFCDARSLRSGCTSHL